MASLEGFFPLPRSRKCGIAISNRLGKQAGEPVGKHAHARRQLPLMGIQHGHGQRVGTHGRQHFHQLTGGQRLLQMVARRLDQAQARAAAGVIRVGIVDGDGARQGHAVALASTLIEGPGLARLGRRN